MTILKQSLQKIALGAAVAALSISAHATTFVFDTGEPGNITYSGFFNYSFEDYIGRAGSFSIGDNTTISSIQAYLGLSQSASNDQVEFFLREGSGDWNGSVVASGNVTVGKKADWYGLTGLSNSVSAGTYTLFVRPQDGAVGQMYTGAQPDKLSATWTFYDDYGVLQIQDSNVATYGIRVGAADPTPVPAPLPILGAVAAIGWSRKLRRRIRESQALAA